MMVKCWDTLSELRSSPGQAPANVQTAHREKKKKKQPLQMNNTDIMTKKRSLSVLYLLQHLPLAPAEADLETVKNSC